MKRIIDYIESIEPDFRESGCWYAGVKKRPDIRIKEYERANGTECRYYKYWPINSEEIALKIKERLEEEGIVGHTDKVPLIFEKYRKDKEKYYVYVFRAENIL